MRQDINLFLLIPKQKGFNLSFRTVVSYYVFFVLLLTVIYVNLALQKKTLEKEFEQENATALALQTEANRLLIALPVSDPTVIRTELKTRQIELINKSAAVDLLLSYSNFSSYLIALARITVPDLWLTQIKFNRGKSNISLYGDTLEASLITQLMKKIEKEPIFKKFTFTIQDLDDKKIPAHFFLESQEATTT